MRKVAVIGMGNMGSAIAESIKDRFSLTTFDIDKAKVEALGFKPCESIQEAIKDADIVLIAIKPQFIDKDFLSSIKEEGKAYISIAAGIPLSSLEKNLRSRNIARFMPNLAAGKLKAVTAIAFKDGADESFRDACMRIAGSFGNAFELSESQFSAFIGISGSLIAYALEFVHDSAMAGVREGIPYDKAKDIVAATLGSASALLSDGESPAAIIPRICSASGTTIAGMAALGDKGFSSALFEAVKAASDRSKELENKSKEMIR